VLLDPNSDLVVVLSQNRHAGQRPGQKVELWKCLRVLEQFALALMMNCASVVDFEGKDMRRSGVDAEWFVVSFSLLQVNRQRS
jgi:hypothetical protein